MKKKMIFQQKKIILIKLVSFLHLLCTIYKHAFFFFFFLRKRTMLLLYIKKTEGHSKRKIQCPVEHAPPRQIKEKKCLAL